MYVIKEAKKEKKILINLFLYKLFLWREPSSPLILSCATRKTISENVTLTINSNLMSSETRAGKIFILWYYWMEDVEASQRMFFPYVLLIISIPFDQFSSHLMPVLWLPRWCSPKSICMTQQLSSRKDTFKVPYWSHLKKLKKTSTVSSR